jgi:hypothetical protein
VGRPSATGGVSARGSNGIQYDFMLKGVRYRPTVKRCPSEANLQRARKQMAEIKRRIADGTFDLGAEFPDYRFMRNVTKANARRTCNQVFDEYLQQC